MMKNLLTNLRRWFSFADIVFLLAVASLTYGVSLIYAPAAWIVVGLLFIIVTTWAKFKGDQP